MRYCRRKNRLALGSAAAWPCAALLVLSLAGCDLGGGGGGGPALEPLPPRPAYTPPDTLSDPVAYGATVFKREGCALCHGDNGAGGVNNANSETGGKIVALTLVKEGYTAEQLAKRIREGVLEVGKKDKAGPTPPLRMPPYGAWLPKGDVTALTAWIFSLYPADRATEDSGWDDEDEDELPAPAAATTSTAATPGAATANTAAAPGAATAPAATGEEGR